jgi:hypothetical protein
MRITRLLVVLCIAIISGTSINFAAIKPGVIIVKFKYNSPLAERWLAEGRIGEFSEFTSLIGSHFSQGFVSNSTLQAVAKREAELYPSLNKSTELQPLTRNLSLISVLNCAQSIDVELLARKLASNPNVEYAEPMPEQSLVFEPNDPKFLSEQYNVQAVKAIEAWDLFPPNTEPILLAIVDTGVDYNHEDLAPNIFINSGESGTDAQGRDKRTNGIDDDGNGFIDDWHGWDFVSSTDPSRQDNNPLPGHPHGTHCAGIAAAVINNAIGIAGTARYVRILPVKIGNDKGSSSLENGFDGILYAASIGAKVINCSWGSPTPSRAEAETVTAATSLGSLIVAAAGNDGLNLAYYPASYPGVISVAATRQEDVIAGYSNFNRRVDVSAPGTAIYSTLPDNSYGNMSGTSMASPCAAGVTAMLRQKFPNYTPEQIKEQLKATADNIDSVNPNYIGYIGSGRVNAIRAITGKNTRAILLSRYQVKDSNNNGFLELDERVEVLLTIKNILLPIQNLVVEPKFPDGLGVIFSPQTFDAGNFSTLEERQLTIPLVFTVPHTAPENYNMDIRLTFRDSLGTISTGSFALTVNPTYRTMDANNIAVTFNSIGNIGFNDYPSNFQGDGFIYKKKSNLLFEGALMVGTSAERLSNVARSSYNSNTEDKSFVLRKSFTIRMPGIVSAEDGTAEFADLDNPTDAGVSIKHNAYQFSGNDNDDFVIVTYDITNSSARDFTTLHAGLYFDWDIGPSGLNNVARLDEQDGFGYAYCIKPDTLPAVAVALLSPQQLNFFAADNDGSSADNPNIYDGFTRNLKWRMLSSGIGRRASNPTDISMVIGAGPMNLPHGETVRVGFAIGAADKTGNLRSIIAKARQTAKDNNLASGFVFEPLPNTPSLVSLTPNAVSNESFTVNYALADNATVKIDIVNILGSVVKTVKNGFVQAGARSETVTMDDAAQGTYFVRFQSSGKMMVLPFFVVR